jgi:type 1 glutamine amidotransferase
MKPLRLALVGFALFVVAPSTFADPPKRIVLLGQKPDTHPRESHEYMAGVRLVARMLERFPDLRVQVVQADSPWKEGPEILADADGVFLYLTEGARWLSEDPARLQAFEKLAARGGGLVALHWAMGTKIAEPVPAYLKLFGACHGGPDRKTKDTDVEEKVLDRNHPITRGLNDFRLPDEWYYRLKLVPLPAHIDPLLAAQLEGKAETVAWAFSRPDGGRSAGFTGLHYHVNWKNENYRRFVVQAILWSVKQDIPQGGVNVDLPADAYQLPK